MSTQQASGELDFKARAKTNDVPIARLIGFEALEIGDGRATVGACRSMSKYSAEA